MNRNLPMLVLLAFGLMSCGVSVARAAEALRPPAVPLVTCDPYFSVWSFKDRLTDDETRHWTGKQHTLLSLVRIDGKPCRLAGAQPKGVPALEQAALTVLPTRTIYTFAGGGVELTLTFMTPMLPADLDVLTPAADVRDVAGGFHRRQGARREGDAGGGRRPGREHAGAIGRRAARAGGRADGAGDWLGSAAGAAQQGRRSPHRLGLPLPDRAERRGRGNREREQPGEIVRRRWQAAGAGRHALSASGEVWVAVGGGDGRSRVGVGQAGPPARDGRVRRPVLDPVHEEESATLLAAGRHGRGEAAPGGGEGLRVARRAVRQVR